MEILIENEKHKIIYIEYQDKLPFKVITAKFIETAKNPYWIPYQWDFFACNGDVKEILAYNSGFGGEINQLQASHYVETFKGASYWIDDCAKLEKQAININRLKNPILLKNDWISSKNPFKIAQITHSHEYCDICNYFSDEFCNEHKYFDAEGYARYKHDNSFE
jgi:hypothetical protein